VERYIIESFPRNQHRPVLLHYGTRVPFAADIDHVVRFIPACSDSYERFLNAIRVAAKRHVLRGFRKVYIRVE
jgi:hypothetical protein